MLRPYAAVATHSSQLRGTLFMPVSSIVRCSPSFNALEPSSSGTPGSAPSMNNEKRPMSSSASGVISMRTRSTAGRVKPACTHNSPYSSAERNWRATAWALCWTSSPRSRSTCTARTTQRRQNPAVPLDVSAVEERRIERKHAVRLQRLADLGEHLRLVGHEVDGVQEHDRIGRRDEARYPLGAALDELDDSGVDGGSGFGEG